MDIVVTTPKSEMTNAAKEAENCIKDGGGYYFRCFKSVPCNIQVNEKIWYLEDGYIRGYAVVDRIDLAEKIKDCQTTGKTYRGGCTVYMRADSWKWIEPIRFPVTGFRGYRRALGMQDIKPVGGWKDPKPDNDNICKCDGCGNKYIDTNPSYEFGEFNLCQGCKKRTDLQFE